MRPDEADAVAALVHDSTNAWYRKNRGFEVFSAGPQSCRLFTDVYEALDPGRCVVAEDPATGRLMGSCFYHPRTRHVSLGIMNVHPDFAGRGVASLLLKHVTEFADAQDKPVRLVSSAMNLDSFSLYSRAGFQPQAVFADMQVPVERALQIVPPAPGPFRLRPAAHDDVRAIAALEEELSDVRRDDDFAYFVRNDLGVWRTTVAAEESGKLLGVLVSIGHPASCMLGPGAMVNDVAVAKALIAEHLLHHALEGRAPVALIPLHHPELVRQMYAWGAKNLELHLAQVRGPTAYYRGIIMPTFMPETG